MSSENGCRWCVFTSAGDRNAIRAWTESDAPRRWDLVIAYYGDSEVEFADLGKRAAHAFRQKGSKFQNLRQLLLREPGFFDRYSHVWVCDDDILMSPAQIDESFAIADGFDFWVAQPAFRVEGKISFWFTYPTGPKWDFHIVNFIEENTPIFRREKLLEFLAVYDGVHSARGIDCWYMNVLNFDTFGKFAIIDRVQVVNPFDDVKGGEREIDRLKSLETRIAEFAALRASRSLVDYKHKILAYGKIVSLADKTAEITAGIDDSPQELRDILDWLETHRPDGWSEAASCLRAFDDDIRWRFAIFLARGLTQLTPQNVNRVHPLRPPFVAFVQYLSVQPMPAAKFRKIAEATAWELKVDSLPVFGVAYADGGAIVEVRVETFGATRPPPEQVVPQPAPQALNRQQRRAAERRSRAKATPARHLPDS